MATEHRWWISWWASEAMGEWELRRPWWISGERVHGDETCDVSIVAAVIADTEEAAKEIILACYDKRPKRIEWRFCEQQPDDWCGPFGGRFPRADWMEWPC